LRNERRLSSGFLVFRHQTLPLEVYSSGKIQAPDYTKEKQKCKFSNILKKLLKNEAVKSPVTPPMLEIKNSEALR
jgi:hypothetical protein